MDLFNAFKVKYVSAPHRSAIDCWLFTQPPTKGPESVYRAYRRNLTNHLSLDKLRFKAMQEYYIFFYQSDNFTNLSYELAILSMVPVSVIMLPYFIEQIIFSQTN